MDQLNKKRLWSVASLLLFHFNTEKKGFLVKCIGKECKQVSTTTQYLPLLLSLLSGDTKRGGGGWNFLLSIFAISLGVSLALKPNKNNKNE